MENDSCEFKWRLRPMEDYDYGLIAIAIYFPELIWLRNSFILCASINKVSAVVIQPLHAKQSYNETRAAWFSPFYYLIKSGFLISYKSFSGFIFALSIRGLMHSYEGAM
jgi:hypothetical protein